MTTLCLTVKIGKIILIKDVIFRILPQNMYVQPISKNGQVALLNVTNERAYRGFTFNEYRSFDILAAELPSKKRSGKLQFSMRIPQKR